MSSKQTLSILVWSGIPGKTIGLLEGNRLLMEDQGNQNEKISDSPRSKEIHRFLRMYCRNRHSPIMKLAKRHWRKK
jgi:hypothetical protein